MITLEIAAVKSNASSLLLLFFYFKNNVNHQLLVVIYGRAYQNGTVRQRVRREGWLIALVR